MLPSVSRVAAAGGCCRVRPRWRRTSPRASRRSCCSRRRCPASTRAPSWRRSEDEREPPVSDRLGEIDVPATVAVGDRDVADFARIAERLSEELPDARLEHVQDAGHVLALDRPAAVAQLVERHLAALTRRASPPR